MKPELVPAILAKNRKQLIAELREISPFTKKVQVDFEDGKFTFGILPGIRLDAGPSQPAAGN